MKPYDYVVVGSGLFGAVFAHEMHKRNKKVLVIDKRSHIGGNVYTRDDQGIQVHEYGAHIFHTSDKRLWDYVNSFVPFKPFINAPLAIYEDEMYHMPFNMNTFHELWGVKTPKEARAKLEEQRALGAVENPSNLEEQAISLAGPEIYEKLIKGYTQKQWGRPCDQLPAFIIKRLPFRFTYNNNYFNDTWQGIPQGGYTALVEKMLEGVEVKLDTDFFANREYYENLGEKLVYTGRVDEFFDQCLGPLDWRSLRFETERLDEDDYQGNAVINYTSASVPWTRIIEHKHFDFQNQPGTIVTREYPAEYREGMEPYYPVNDDANNALYARYKELADARDNVIFGGRLGTYKYYDMHQVIDAALKAVEDLEPAA